MYKFSIKFDNISIRRKFILVYIFCIFLPVVAGAIVWMAFTSQEMWLNSTHYLEQNFEGTAGDFNILSQTAINIGNQVNADRTLREDLSKGFITPVEHYELYWTSLRNRFQMYLVSNPDIAEISLYIDDPHFINTDFFRVLDNTVRRSDWYRMASESTSNIIVYPGTTAISITPYKNRVTLIRKIKDPNFLNNATNYLLIELKLDRVISELNEENRSMDTYLTVTGDKIIWDTQHTIIDSYKTAPILKLPPDNKYYIFQKDIGTTPYFNGWKITGIYDKNQIYKKQLAVLFYILLITLALAAFSVFLIWSVLNSMRYRLTALSSHIKKVKEDHFEPLPLGNPGQDEVGWLITAFNKMIAEIDDLINEVYKLEIEKKSIEVENIRAEYKYLQAQVDPHFLFNTLNAILVFCVKNNYTELSAVISSLSKLFKRLLITGSDLITVTEEFDFIDKYLAIEKFRFGNKFKYDIQISPEVIESKRLIPKMSIQPIVENACKHGLQSSSDDNRLLQIKADIEDKALVITVKDNGAGMDEEMVEAIMNRLENPGTEEASARDDSGSGVGIRNVYQRMIMNYSERFHFTIQSALGHGTEITLRIEDV
ncbi:MAG TPA: sensor histidine kinase [Clostridia bacterium]|nr:sensor histidine kinase [Clostridia bacterium]